jgi:SAM-dependent methyltransferase
MHRGCEKHERGAMTTEREYVLGTHDEEIARLGLQHRAWRNHALAAWESAGVGPSQTVLDVGCGPGYASLDLAEVVGPSGRVVAIDKSERFLEALEGMRRQRGLERIASYRADLDAGDFYPGTADRAWCRWVLSFVKNPREVLARIAAALGPGGVVVLHEYFDYATWRSAPRCSELEEFVAAVMASWRDQGGEPDVGLAVPGWLEELGFEIRCVRPIVEIVEINHLSWEWLRTFIEVGRKRLLDLGYLSVERAESIWQVFTRLEATPGRRMITPAVLEVVAVRKALQPPMNADERR